MVTTDSPPAHWLVQDFERLQFLKGAAREKFSRHLDYAANLEISRVKDEFHRGEYVQDIEGLIKLLDIVDEREDPVYCRVCGAPQPREDDDQDDCLCDECANGTWLGLQRHWADYAWA